MTTEPAADPLSLPWRTGNHNARTVYAQAPGGDVPIGMLDTPELAAEACAGHNHLLWVRRSGGRLDRAAVASEREA